MGSDVAEIVSINEQLESASAEERVGWALEQFGEKLVLSSSFGIQAAVMLHLVNTIVPGIPVVFVDTGYLFPETYRFAEELRERLNLNVKKFHATSTAAEQEALWGKLWEQGLEGLETYNFLNKVEPMNRAIQELGAEAWLVGLRRGQAQTRQNLRVVESQNKICKVHPIIDWSDRDVYQYLQKHGLPYHPLWDEGYVSVGDWHSSRKLGAGMTAEETRFNGLKRECGLHELSGRIDFQI
jgi:phosphoadenosine phosphosulfate reductase